MSAGPGPGGPQPGGAPPVLPANSAATIAAAMGATTPPPAGGPAPPAPPPVGGPSPSGPSPVSPYADLPADLPHHYQLLDVADRQLKQAIATGGFYREPEVLAAIRHHESGLAKIIASYARGGGKGPLEAPAVITSAERDDDPGGIDDETVAPLADNESVSLE